jgi:hypothetical protein
MGGIESAVIVQRKGSRAVARLLSRGWRETRNGMLAVSHLDDLAVCRVEEPPEVGEVEDAEGSWTPCRVGRDEAATRGTLHSETPGGEALSTSGR